MKNWMIAVSTVAWMAVASSAQAAEVTKMQKCQGAIKVIAEMKADEDTPEIGEKAESEVDTLVEVATRLCELGDFEFADRLMQIARGMMVSE